MPDTLITYQGCLVTPYMAWVLDGVDAWLHKQYRLGLIVRWGIRTEAEQERIFRERYVTAGNVHGRKVYDVRSWNGVLWYRIDPAGTVAVPNSPQANHQIQGTGAQTRAACDIADTGADAGVTVKTSVRGRAIRAAAKALHIEFEGDSFGEGWHILIRNIWQARPAPAGIPTTPTKPAAPEKVDEIMAAVGFQYKGDDNKTGSVVVNPDNGFYHEWWSEGASYNANEFKAFGVAMSDVAQITLADRNNLIRDAQNLRKGA